MTREHDDRGERDVPTDRKVAWSRKTGGVPRADTPDQHSTTGTTDSDVFVGRVSGTDVGYAEETGAERRAREDADDAQDGKDGKDGDR